MEGMYGDGLKGLMTHPEVVKVFQDFEENDSMADMMNLKDLDDLGVYGQPRLPLVPAPVISLFCWTLSFPLHSGETFEEKMSHPDFHARFAELEGEYPRRVVSAQMHTFAFLIATFHPRPVFLHRPCRIPAAQESDRRCS